MMYLFVALDCLLLTSDKQAAIAVQELQNVSLDRVKEQLDVVTESYQRLLRMRGEWLTVQQSQSCVSRHLLWALHMTMCACAQ